MQARAYESQLQARRELGLLPQVREAFVSAPWDLEGRRIAAGAVPCGAWSRSRATAAAGPASISQGSGHRASAESSAHPDCSPGGDSRRLPAYGPCGKIFVPLPGAPASSLPPALFDRLVLPFWRCPRASRAGDRWWWRPATLLIRFERGQVRVLAAGLIALGCHLSARRPAGTAFFAWRGGAVSYTCRSIH